MSEKNGWFLISFASALEYPIRFEGWSVMEQAYLSLQQSPQNAPRIVRQEPRQRDLFLDDRGPHLLGVHRVERR